METINGEKLDMSIDQNWFPQAVPAKPTGYYAHIVVVRETTSYAVFQTDGELNTVRVTKGLQNRDLMTRLTMFKRKRTTPERLTGRELLRRYDFLSDQYEGDKDGKDSQGRLICDYNVNFCNQCPDCITYGFAIGDSGSEKSKVISDTAFSLTDYGSSHEVFTLNAPYESGTMSREGEVTSRINEADHVTPQTFFPTIITLRDATHALFEYVLNNVIRTRHYGAQTTRTGAVKNHIVAIVLTDGEIVSNLKLTQALYDELAKTIEESTPDPVAVGVVVEKSAEILPKLLKQDGVTVDQLLIGDDLSAALDDFNARLRDRDAVNRMLTAAFADSSAYYKAYIQKK